MENGISTGKVIALITAIATKIAREQSAIGISSIVAGPGANQITFNLSDGSHSTVTLTFNAAGISFTPVSGMTSATVQAAIEEVFTLANKALIEKDGSYNLSLTQSVTADSDNGVTFDGMTLKSTETGAVDSAEVNISLPIIPGDGIHIDADETNEHIVISYAGGSVDISGKADKVENAVAGDFAGLDANGNLTDSGKKAGDFLPSNAQYVSSVNSRSGAVTGLEETSNKTTTISASSTDTEYPSAKAVYDNLGLDLEWLD